MEKVPETIDVQAATTARAEDQEPVAVEFTPRDPRFGYLDPVLHEDGSITDVDGLVAPAAWVESSLWLGHLAFSNDP